MVFIRHGLLWVSILYPQYIICLWREGAQNTLNWKISYVNQLALSIVAVTIHVKVPLEHYHILPSDIPTLRKPWTLTNQHTVFFREGVLKIRLVSLQFTLPNTDSNLSFNAGVVDIYVLLQCSHNLPLYSYQVHTSSGP